MKFDATTIVAMTNDQASYHNKQNMDPSAYNMHNYDYATMRTFIKTNTIIIGATSQSGFAD